jgi:hypothetical protein
LKQM